jgi:thiamine biosynthesis protein ThiI
MQEMILCKLGEVVLKGLNRRSFEMKLMSNIRRRVARFGKFKIYSKQSTIYVEPAESTCDVDGAVAACKQIFGIISVARGGKLTRHLDAKALRTLLEEMYGRSKPQKQLFTWLQNKRDRKEGQA